MLANLIKGKKKYNLMKNSYTFNLHTEPANLSNPLNISYILLHVHYILQVTENKEHRASFHPYIITFKHVAE